MIRNIFFSVLLSCCGQVSFGQDTTYQRIMSAKDDTLKVQELVNHGRYLLDVDNAAADPVFKSSIAISDRLQYHKGAGQGWMGIAYINAQKGAYRLAIESYTNAAIHLRKINLINRATECMNTVATIYDFLGKRDSAISIYMQSAKLLENTGYLAALGSTYSYIGVLHHNANDYEKAVFYKTKAVDLLRKAKDTVYLVEALTELGDTYAKKRESLKGMPLAHEALQLANYVNRDNSARSVLATAYYTLSVLHLELHELDSATAEARLCVEHAEASGDINTYISGVLVLSDCYLQLGQKSERYNVLIRALQDCKKVGNVVLLHDTYQRLADAAYQLRKYDDAYDFHKSFMIYKDSLFNQKNQTILSELEVKYQTAQKEKVLSQQKLNIAEKEVQLQKSKQVIYRTLGGLVIALLLIGLLYLNSRSKKRAHQRQLQSLKQEKEIHLLQALMQGEEKERSRIAKDLHDGVAGMLAAAKMHLNTLQVHDGEWQGFQQANKLLDEAAMEVRKTSHNLMPEVLTQHGLDEALRRYCSNINNSKILVVQYDAIGTIGRCMDSFELSIYRIVQELLNNIIKHSKASEALVQVSQQDNLLSITIEDNGIGFQDKGKKDGMGLQSLQSRVKAMNGKMQVEAETGSGVCAYLEFDVLGLEKEPAYAVN